MNAIITFLERKIKMATKLLERNFWRVLFSWIIAVAIIPGQIVEAVVAAPQVNGLFYGDGDVNVYTKVASALNNRGTVYAYNDGTKLYFAVVVSATVNDNVFDKSRVLDYVRSVGWPQGRTHIANDLIQSDKLSFAFACNGKSYSWSQDLAYLENGVWKSGPAGSDGGGTPPPGASFASSTAWNFQNSRWWQIDPGARGSSYSEWRSPGYSEGKDFDKSAHGYPRWDSQNEWEWSLVYEFSFPHPCPGAPFYFAVTTAHNSPPKDGNENVQILSYDHGDAPAPYPTTVANAGARHALTPELLRLGAMIDAEPDGQPTVGAGGDDLVFTDDEDGVVFSSVFVQGRTTTVTVTASGEGHLNAWIDFNRDGDWNDDGEKIFSDVMLTAGSNTLTFTTPDNASPGDTYARFRFSTQTGLLPTGTAPDGEVEDYQVTILDKTKLDFGDLPDTGAGTGPGNYRTLSSDHGAAHGVISGLNIGATIDSETDGFSTVNADGDDLNGMDDEDGVNISDLTLFIGKAAQIRVTVTNTTAKAATLYGFLDLNKNGSFSELGEAVSYLVPPGSVNTVITCVFGNPVAGSAGTTYARFRLSTDPAAANPYGVARDGEVEDYKVTIVEDEPLDWGDAPDTDVGVGPGNYQTLANDDGPRHIVTQSLLMGSRIDAEMNGQPTPGANGDDNMGIDDEDGIAEPIQVTLRTQPTLRVRVKNTTGTPAVLTGWIDYNKNGVFENSERASVIVPNGTDGIVNLTMPPAVGQEGITFARFRLSTQDDNGDGHLESTGILRDGEVEDYLVLMALGFGSEDHGDAPESYGDAAHTNLDPDLQLGPPDWENGGVIGNADAEEYSYFSGNASGDNKAGEDDENGIVFFPPLRTNMTSYAVQVQVFNQTASDATLVGWIDFNRDGKFSATEAATVSVPAGTIGTITLQWNNLTGLTAGMTYARFRLAPTGEGLSASTWDGTVSGGEVEDYVLNIDQPISVTLTSFRALRTSEGVEIEWVVKAVFNHAGYNVYRSQTENGTYTRLNEKLITPEEALEDGRYVFIDRSVSGSPFYMLEEVSLNGTAVTYGPAGTLTASGVESASAPTRYELRQNYPNPFNPTTTIGFDLPQAGRVRLTVFDMSGRIIRTLVDGELSAGRHEAVWDSQDDGGRAVASGMYIVIMETDFFRDHRKMILVR